MEIPAAHYEASSEIAFFANNICADLRAEEMFELSKDLKASGLDNEAERVAAALAGVFDLNKGKAESFSLRLDQEIEDQLRALTQKIKQSL